ncbi:MAG: ABC transporter ATP-binding protein [Anaerolineae bacterium]
MPPILCMRGITKRFPGILANDRIDLEVEEGEIHALLGENGAGKTTLMNILYGLYEPQEGEIFFQGRSIRVTSPHQAINLGIGMVHQHFMLIPVFTVAENIVLGLRSSRGLILDIERARQRIFELSKQYGLGVDPQAYVWQLSVGLQQRVEIIKALYRGAKLLILDEPTAVLTPQETGELFHILRSLAQQGTSIIFISHKLNEVMGISDRITVLRDGRVVNTVRTRDTNQAELARMMVGREVVLRIERPPRERGEPILEVKDLQVLNDKGLPALEGTSLQVHRGEILGLAGVDGNGQLELAETLVGLRRPTAGRIVVKGHDVTGSAPSTLIRMGVACIPQDRKAIGSIGEFSLAENAILGSHDQPPFARYGLLNRPAIHRYTQHLINSFDVRTPGAELQARSLSGGNLQKLILAREVSRPHDILIAVQPTRGLDVGATEFVYRRLIEERQNGKAILLISTELDEVLSLSDRIAVIYEGRIVGEMMAEEALVEEIGLLMTGSHHKFQTEPRQEPWLIADHQPPFQEEPQNLV